MEGITHYLVCFSRRWVEEMLRDVQAVQRTHAAQAVLCHQVHKPTPQVHHLSSPRSKMPRPASRFKMGENIFFFREIQLKDSNQR